MLDSIQHRQPRLLWVLTSLGLALSVFLWGLQYKLSLYDPPQAASHQVPIAKLLSKNEQPGIPSDSAAAQLANSAVRLGSTLFASGTLLLLFAIAALPGGLVECLASTEDASPRFRHLRIHNLFVRPPPSLS